MTWCSSGTTKRKASPGPRLGRLAWKVKGSVSTWIRPSFWSLVMTRMSSRNLASTLVLSAVVLLAETPSCGHSVYCGSTRHRVWCGTMLDVEATFCYLGGKLFSGGDYDSAIAGRYCVAWGKFRKLLPVLTIRSLSPRICDKVYGAWVRSAMLHGDETWGPKGPEKRQLHHNDCAMIRWICGTKDRDETPSASLLLKIASKTVHRSFAVGDSDGISMYNGPRPVSNLWKPFHYSSPEIKAKLERHGPNMWRPISVTQLALTH